MMRRSLLVGPDMGTYRAVSFSLVLSLSLLLSLFLLCENATMKITKATLIADPRVQRLLKNPNWKHAAEAAIDYIFNGTECQIASWRKSSTWAQVMMVWEELNKTR
jgi:hypothetical protein